MEHQTRLDLSRNVCYDRHLSYNINPNRYGMHSKCIHTLVDYYSYEYIDVGLGISELINRLGSFLNDHNLKLEICNNAWQGVYNLNVLSGSDALYIVNPNGIDGSYITRDKLYELSNSYQLVIIDEAYGDFCNQSMVECKPDNVIILKTLSKSIAMPGARFGWCISNKYINEYLSARRPRSSVVGGLEDILPDILREVPNHVKRMVETKDYLYPLCEPSHGNYVIFKEENEFTEKFICNYDHNRIRMALVDTWTLMN